MGETKISEKLLQSGELASGDGHGMVFSFFRGASYCCLFLCVPENRTCVELNEITSGGSVGSRTACPI